MAAQSDKDQMATQVDWLGDFGDKGSTECLSHNTIREGAKGQGAVSHQRNGEFNFKGWFTQITIKITSTSIISSGFTFLINSN